MSVRPAAEQVVEPLFEFFGAGGDEPDRSDGVCLDRMQGVRQPLRPLPQRATLDRHAYRDQQIVGSVERDQLGEHRPDEIAGRVVRRVLLPGSRRRAGHEHPGEAAQRHRHR
jgi:hypothetical protein